jgi:hypothetical protein
MTFGVPSPQQAHSILFELLSQDQPDKEVASFELTVFNLNKLYR